MLRDAMAISLDPWKGQGRLNTSAYLCARTPPAHAPVCRRTSAKGCEDNVHRQGGLRQEATDGSNRNLMSGSRHLLSAQRGGFMRSAPRTRENPRRPSTLPSQCHVEKSTVIECPGLQVNSGTMCVANRERTCRR